MPARKDAGSAPATSVIAVESVRAEGATPLSAAPLTARGARTRSTLVKAARSLFEKRGYLDTNVGDIAGRARVAHGTFYTYFNSKEEIFAEVADALLQDFQRIADEEPHVPAGGHVSERIERANRGYLKAYEANARMMAVLEQVATFNPRLAAVRRASRRFWVQRGAESIRRWQEHGMVDERIDPGLRGQRPRLDGRPLRLRVDRPGRALRSRRGSHPAHKVVLQRAGDPVPPRLRRRRRHGRFACQQAFGTLPTNLITSSTQRHDWGADAAE